MGKKKFEFVVENQPSEEVLRESYRILAEGLISKYGLKNMQEVVRQYEARKNRKGMGNE